MLKMRVICLTFLKEIYPVFQYSRLVLLSLGMRKLFYVSVLSEFSRAVTPSLLANSEVFVYITSSVSVVMTTVISSCLRFQQWLNVAIVVPPSTTRMH